MYDNFTNAQVSYELNYLIGNVLKPECDVIHDCVWVLHGVEGGLVAAPLGHGVQVVRPLRAARINLLGNAELVGQDGGAVCVADGAEDLRRSCSVLQALSVTMTVLGNR